MAVQEIGRDLADVAERVDTVPHQRLAELVEAAGRPRHVAHERARELVRELEHRAGRAGRVAEELTAPEQIEDLRGLLRRDGQAGADDAAAHLERAHQDVRAARVPRRLAGHEELEQGVAEPLAIGPADLPGHLIEQIERAPGRRPLPDPEHRERRGEVERAKLVDQPLTLDPVDRGVPEAVEPLHRDAE